MMATATPRQLSGLIEQLARGDEPEAVSLTLFSDLSRDESAQLRSAWPSIPPEVRAIVMLRATDLAENRIDLDFTQLGLIGLGDELAEVRESAAEGLSDSPLRMVAERLFVVLQGDSDDDVRAAAAGSLRQFVALREFGQFDERLGDSIIAALRSALEDSESTPLVRANALESLGPCSLPWVSEFILNGYNSEDPPVRLAALVAMGDTAEERWLDYLVEQFYSDVAEFRCVAVLSAGLVGSEEAVEPLAALLQDEDSDVVLATIAAIGAIGGDEAVEVLTAFAPAAPEEFKELLAEALQTAAEFASSRTAEGGDYGEEDGE